jgi:hypothetical protein
MGVRATLIELFKRYTRNDNSEKKIYKNGDNNLYPNEIERIINNSPTAKRCALLMSKYITGEGLVNPLENINVNTKKNYKLSDIIGKIALSIAYQYGAFIHVGYGITENGELSVKSLDVLDYLKCRISKEDDQENKGKIYYKDYEDRYLSYNDSNEKWFYPYNSDRKIVSKQIEKDFNDSQKNVRNKKPFNLSEAIQTYRGQVYYLNLSPYIYALSPVDSVYNDADSEFRISLYTNTQTRTGFVGKTIFITNGLDEEKNKNIKKDISEFMGAENSGNVWHLDVETTEDINNVLKVDQLKAQYDDKLFSETITRIRKNILGAFNNVPEALIFSGEGALFSTSGETYGQMKRFYSEQTAEERRKIEETIQMFGFPCEIKKIGTDDL